MVDTGDIMASVTLDIGAPTLNASTLTGWTGLSLPIPASLVVGSAGTNLIQFLLPRNTNNNVSVSTASTTADLTPAWEQNDNAVTIIRMRGGTEIGRMSIVGPDVSTNVFRDTTEPYAWRPANIAEVVTFNVANQRGDTYQLILSDEPAYTPTLKQSNGKFVHRIKQPNGKFLGAIKYPLQCEFQYVAQGFELPDPVPAFAADYTVVAGTASGWTGYWFNNDGSIVGDSYTFTRPDGSSSSVRQTMVQNRTAPLRFAMTTQGLNISQFPPTITTVLGDTSITWTRPSSSFNVGQGSAANYETTTPSADVQAIFTDDNNIQVALNYD